MSTPLIEKESTNPEPLDRNAPPPFDREAARARYKKFMRSWPMRTMYLVLVLTILFAWGWAGAAAFAPSVERLPGHDITVATQACVSCHTDGAVANDAPPMNHPVAPSCGFCHRQSVPQTGSAPLEHGWLLDQPTQQAIGSLFFSP
jgi:cytochrome c553